MRIAGIEPDAWLEIEAMPEVSDHTFAITAALGPYRVANDIPVTGAADFLADLHRFVVTRQGEAVLLGAYDFELVVAAHGVRGEALVRFRVTDTVPCPPILHGHCRLVGAIVVPGEMVEDMVRSLRQSMANAGR